MIDKKISEDAYFHVKDGPILSSLLALRIYLRTISYAEFTNHVAAGKNDFADWVEDAFDEKELAKKMRLAQTREQLVWLLDDAFSDWRMEKVIAEQSVEQLPVTTVQGGVQYTDPVELAKEGEFEKYSPDIVRRNEEIGKKYEGIAKNLQQALQNPIPKNIEALTEKIKQRYVDLQVKVSEARRSGKDMLIPALVLRRFPPKLALAQVTREEKDFMIAATILDEAEYELKEAIAQKVQDFKKEVLELAGLAKPPGS